MHACENLCPELILTLLLSVFVLQVQSTEQCASVTTSSFYAQAAGPPTPMSGSRSITGRTPCQPHPTWSLLINEVLGGVSGFTGH